MKVCVIQPPYSTEYSDSANRFRWELDALNRCDASLDMIVLPEYANVRYLGSLNRNQVLDLLQHSQIGIATLLNVGQYNQFDNLATKVYEYMSLALPVVLSKSPFNQKMIDTYQFGICVDPDNPQEIADAIRWLLDHPEEARAMGENGRRAVETEFNWKVEEEKLLASTPVPLPGAPGRVTPTPAPEAIDIIIDAEAMGDLADLYIEATPSPTPIPISLDEEEEIDDLEMLEEDYFPDDL